MIEPPSPWAIIVAGRVLDAEENRPGVDGERGVPVVDLELGDRPERAADAGVVEHHVEPAERLDGERDQRLDVGLVETSVG